MTIALLGHFRGYFSAHRIENAQFRGKCTVADRHQRTGGMLTWCSWRSSPAFAACPMIAGKWCRSPWLSTTATAPVRWARIGRPVVLSGWLRRHQHLMQITGKTLIAHLARVRARPSVRFPVHQHLGAPSSSPRLCSTIAEDVIVQARN